MFPATVRFLGTVLQVTAHHGGIQAAKILVFTETSIGKGLYTIISTILLGRVLFFTKTSNSPTDPNPSKPVPPTALSFLA